MPVEVRAMSFMIVSPGGHVTCRVLLFTVTDPSCVKPDDLEKISKTLVNLKAN